MADTDTLYTDSHYSKTFTAINMKKFLQIVHASMNGYVLLFLFLFFSLTGFAQKGYLPGYVVLQNGDTLSGKLRDRKEGSFQKLYPKIYWKGSKGRAKKYGPDQLAGYAIGTNQFESRWIKHESWLFREIYYSREGVGERRFMRVVKKGTLSLYHLEFLDSESIIIDRIELCIREGDDKFIRTSQGIFGLRKKALAEYLSDYPELADKIRSGAVTNILYIANEYNQWIASGK